jgi:hypothetical protein
VPVPGDYLVGAVASDADRVWNSCGTLPVGVERLFGMEEPGNPASAPTPRVPLWGPLDPGVSPPDSLLPSEPPPSSPDFLSPLPPDASSSPPDSLLPLPSDPPPPPAAPTGRDRGLMIAIVGAVAAFAVVTSVVAVLALRGGEEPGTAAPAALSVTTGVATASSAPNSSRAAASTLPPSTVPSLGPPPVSSPAPGAVPHGYRQVSGPGGIMVSIPEGWPVRQGATASNLQADDPDSPGDLIRFGGSPSPAVSLLDAVTQNETNTPNIRDGYKRLRLAQVSGAPDTVEWEFLFIKDGEPRHAFGQFWRLDGIDYVVYVSAGTDTWTRLQPALDVLVHTAGPK